MVRLAELQAYVSGDQEAAAPRMGPILRSPADFSEALAAAKAAAAAAGGGSTDAGSSHACCLSRWCTTFVCYWESQFL